MNPISNKTVRQPLGIQSFLSQTLAVLVLYKNSPTDSPTIKTLGKIADGADGSLDLFVYDNSPDPEPIYFTNDRFLVVSLHHDPANSGVSKAYNQGARRAQEMGKRWLLLLDQDTVFPSQALEKYAAAVQANPDIHLFAPRLVSGERLCSPCGYLWGAGYHLKKAEAGLLRLKGRGVLNSGLLVSVDAFNAIGCFDERIPLDFADHDFCRRFAERIGTAYIIDLVCEHGFSRRENTSEENALARFVFFCRGARFSSRSLPEHLIHTIVVLARAMMLTFKYRTWKFMPIILQEYV